MEVHSTVEEDILEAVSPTHLVAKITMAEEDEFYTQDAVTVEPLPIGEGEAISMSEMMRARVTETHSFKVTENKKGKMKLGAGTFVLEVPNGCIAEIVVRKIIDGQISDKETE